MKKVSLFLLVSCTLNSIDASDQLNGNGCRFWGETTTGVLSDGLCSVALTIAALLLIKHTNNTVRRTASTKHDPVITGEMNRDAFDGLGIADAPILYPVDAGVGTVVRLLDQFSGGLAKNNHTVDMYYRNPQRNSCLRVLVQQPQRFTHKRTAKAHNCSQQKTNKDTREMRKAFRKS